MLQREGRLADVAVAIAPALPDVAQVARTVAIPVLGQHTDATPPGATTGFVPAEALRAAGARGSLVNHSEHPLAASEVEATVRALAHAELAAVVCARDAAAARRLAAVRPPYLAVEPPELIGGDRSVSTARPQVVVASVRATHAVSPATHVLCGAGVRDRHDVARALELGSEGVLVASAVALAREPRRAIAELLRGF